MVVECMTCAEIEQKICDLADSLSEITECGGMKISEDGTVFDYSPALEAKKEAIRIYRDMYKLKCTGDGAGELYEFVHVPCVQPATCTGVTCNTPSRMRMNHRRYRR
jgi:hypothetical protein